MTTARIRLPPKLVPVFAPPMGAVQYRWLKGGRGSGKSRNAAKMAAVRGYEVAESYRRPFRILCAREFQSSIRESFHAELKAAIADEPWLEHYYDVGVDYLRSRNGLVECIFRGLSRNPNSIKSLANIDLTIVEEAEDVTEPAWLALEATVFRRPNSELWPLWNPRLDGSPVDQRFVKNLALLGNRAIGAHVNWSDNPFFPQHMKALRALQQQTLDPNTYAHIWEGEYLTNSKTQVLGGKWAIEDFDISEDWDGPYQGGDFGFSQDPVAAVRCYLDSETQTLYVSHEAGAVKLELDDIGRYVCERIPAFGEYVTRWDSARPESISHIKKRERDFPLPLSEPVDKWKGSVEDGIGFLRSLRRIVVHPRCVETIKEMRLYSHKVDRLTGDILPDIVDAWNHYIDAIRYAVAPLVKRQEQVMMFLTGRAQ